MSLNKMFDMMTGGSVSSFIVMGLSQAPIEEGSYNSKYQSANLVNLLKTEKINLG